MSDVPATGEPASPGRLSRLEERYPWLERLAGPFRRNRWLRWGAGTFGVLLLVSFVAFNLLWFSLDLPEEPPRPQSALVITADGQELAAFAEDGLRLETPLTKIAPVAVQAVLAAEDHRFYEHSGLDPISVARAVWKTARGGQQGGSTITQQLVKVDYLNRERSLVRKVKEAVLAVKLERTADKDEILERYLNTVYFGRSAYGIGAAARAYFDIDAADLQPAQAALLAGLIRAPETAEPSEAPDEALRRRASVLTAMVRDGVLEEGEARAAAASELGAVASTRPDLDIVAAPHFVDLVRQQATDAVGESALYSAGLRIVTTLDLRQQQAAERAVAEVLAGEPGPQAALVALDTDGAVRAYVGGRDHAALKLDLVRGVDGGGTGRQPGSTFKPFVLAAALEQGVTLGQPFPAPARLDLDVGGEIWSVDNYGGKDFGRIDVARATADSVNTVYAQLLQRVGPAAVAEQAAAFGITSELRPLPSIALGAAEVAPLELAAAYATLAADGRATAPYSIDRIEDADGEVVWRPERREPEQRVPAEISRTVTHALRDVIDKGTGKGADIGRPAAGKTGTTQNNVDAWFAGYVPGYTAVVWMGDPAGSVPIETAAGRPITGGGLPADIWARFMAVALEGREAADFPAPPDDLLAAPAPPSLRVEPTNPNPGDTLTVTGDGFGTCTGAWYAELAGAAVASAPESGSDSPTRQATLVVPATAPPGPIRVLAFCDDGTGVREVAATEVTVQGPPPTTTSTTTSSTTSTTSPTATTTSTTSTTVARTSTSTSTTTTTSTTAPPRRKE